MIPEQPNDLCARPADAIPDAPVDVAATLERRNCACGFWSCELCQWDGGLPIEFWQRGAPSFETLVSRVGNPLTSGMASAESPPVCPTCRGNNPALTCSDGCHAPMNPTVLQILRAACEEIANPPEGAIAAYARNTARAALEAADRAPGLADDTIALAHVYEAILDHVDNRPEVAEACAKDVLRAIAAYQRGGAKP